MDARFRIVVSDEPLAPDLASRGTVLRWSPRLLLPPHALAIVAAAADLDTVARALVTSWTANYIYFGWYELAMVMGARSSGESFEAFLQAGREPGIGHRRWASTAPVRAGHGRAAVVLGTRGAATAGAVRAALERLRSEGYGRGTFTGILNTVESAPQYTLFDADEVLDAVCAVPCERGHLATIALRQPNEQHPPEPDDVTVVVGFARGFA